MVIISRYEDMPAIKAGRPVVGVAIERILTGIQSISVATGIRQGLGPGVGGGQLKITFAFCRV